MSEEAPLDPRLTERRNPRSRDIDRADAREIVRLIQEEDRRVPEAVAGEEEAIAALVEDVAERLRAGGRLFYVGAGTSGRLGVLDAAECPPTFGTDPHLVQGIIAGGREALVRSQEGAEDDRQAGREEVRGAGVGERDFVLGIATSGTTPYVRAAVDEANRLGAGTGFLSCTEPPESVREGVDHLVTPLVGPEVIAGSTRMKAGTATKLVLNTLTTGVMVRLGKVYENLMVDLQAVSEKLVDRSLRILDAVSGLGEEEAAGLLVRSGGSVKTAVAMHELAASRAMAERALDACGGFLRDALERFRGVEEIPYYACYGEAFDEEDGPALVERLRQAPRRVRRAAAEARSREAGPGRATGGRGHGEEERRGRRGSWSTAQHLAHLIEAETEAFRPRVEALASRTDESRRRFRDWSPSDPPPLGDRDVAALLRRFREEREATLAALQPGLPGAWDRRATLNGEEFALHQLLRGVAQHDAAHATRITEWIHPRLVAVAAGNGAGG